MDQRKKPLIVIVGPTAVGKTEISLRVAECLRGEIISADSRLFYRGMDIGTAKPTREDQDRVPHHLIDVANPDQEWSLAVYLPKAIAAIQQIQQRKNIPFLVGGTGQYIQAIVEGWEIPAIKPDPRLRKAIQRWAEQIGIEGIRERLKALDPIAAEGIDGPNLRRMIRALEVILSSGKRFSDQKTKSGSQFHILQLGLNRQREELFQLIDLRINYMLEQGLVNEVQSLLDAGFSPELSSMSAIGYKQVIKHLTGEISLDEAIRQIKSKTRKFVRQQTNWFQIKDPEIRWFSASTDPTEEIIVEIQQFLSQI